MTALLYPFILVSGVLQAVGNALNAQLRGRLENPWLTATVSFLPIVAGFTLLFFALPRPLPDAASFAAGHGWQAFGGVAGAVAVFGGLAFVDKVGSGPFNGLVITGNILTSLLLDSLGLLGMHGTGFRLLPWLGGALMVAGVAAISLSKPDPEDAEAGDDDDGDNGSGPGGAWLYPFILAAGSLQAVGAALNAGLRKALVNPWLAADVSFIPVALLFGVLFLVRPSPLPTRESLVAVRWWQPLAGVAGAVAVLAGLLFIDKIGAGAFNGLLITANLLASLALDHFGWLGMRRHRLDVARIGGAAAMVGGIALIALFGGEGG